MTDLADCFPYRLPYPSPGKLLDYLGPLLADWCEQVEQTHLAREYDTTTPPEMWAYLALTRLQSCHHDGPHGECVRAELMRRVLGELLAGVRAVADQMQLKDRERNTDT